MEVNDIIKLSSVMDAIRKNRADLGYTNKHMALKLNISLNRYRQIEKGSTTLSLERFIHIAEILQVHPLTLLVPREINEALLPKAS